jgi:hypothetical protein
MVKSMFVSSQKITSRISEDIVSGYHITVEGKRFELISKRPLGRRVLRSLINEEKKERFVLYA